MTKRCPRCGADIPPGSLNCPKCYTEVERDIPADSRSTGYDPHEEARSERLNRRSTNRTIVLLLATIPAFFGLLGLAQIYTDHNDRGGWYMLVRGFITYVILIALVLGMTVFGIFSIILLIIPTLLVGLFYLFQAFICFSVAYFGSFSFLGRQF